MQCIGKVFRPLCETNRGVWKLSECTVSGFHYQQSCLLLTSCQILFLHWQLKSWSNSILEIHSFVYWKSYLFQPKQDKTTLKINLEIWNDIYMKWQNFSDFETHVFCPMCCHNNKLLAEISRSCFNCTLKLILCN